MPGNVSFAQLLWHAVLRGSGEPFGVPQCDVILSSCSCLPGVKQQPLTNPAVIRQNSLLAGTSWLASSEPNSLFRLRVQACPGRANLLCLSAPFRRGSTSSLLRRSWRCTLSHASPLPPAPGTHRGRMDLRLLSLKRSKCGAFRWPVWLSTERRLSRFILQSHISISLNGTTP